MVVRYPKLALQQIKVAAIRKALRADSDGFQGLSSITLGGALLPPGIPPTGAGQCCGELGGVGS